MIDIIFVVGQRRQLSQCLRRLQFIRSLNALLRNARYLSAIGLHARGMTVEESEKLFREQAHQDAGNARQQAARGTYDPAYLNYNMGKLMILKLREDWTKDKGGRKAWKAFHDEFMAKGWIPISLIRYEMLGADDEVSRFWEFEPIPAAD